VQCSALQCSAVSAVQFSELDQRNWAEGTILTILTILTMPTILNMLTILTMLIVLTISAVWRRGQLHMNWSEKWAFNTIQNSMRILLLACAKFQTLQIVEELPPGLYHLKSLKVCALN
jgi:hypothetical protein